eukprot:CAMPEP_0182885056 /NCGR_PEP_ID=MMETSP0034_2-20130328/19381_1 /TAXON_ID=156128 /ORGANISM="Nephroselmis pyriformis, Strain CCMP717" /LENGTH=110 /DNA_ID=CAMNT_0025018303 /DNA_START=28 /DNA_END=357 /DNA_ORIENTATION=+
MAPLFFVYFFEYTINQSMFFALGYVSAGLTSQVAGGAAEDVRVAACRMYVTLQFTYQLGVFVSRSSVACFPVRRLWLLPALQGLNAAIFIGMIWINRCAGCDDTLTEANG